jgi:NAD(P)-dependent dehydrogenase (short-subunit alcohol dehydrogenase family)
MKDDTGRLAGMRVIVTASGGGMGGGIAEVLAAEGADIALNDRLDGTTDEREARIRDSGRDVFSIIANVTRRDGAERLVNAALERWGRIDGLVNVVGGMRPPPRIPVWEISEDDFELAMGLNMRATFHCTQLVLSDMMERRAGKIVNIASNSWAGDPAHAHYAAGKAAVVAFTRSCAIQLGSYNINVNAVSPGATATNPGVRAQLTDAPGMQDGYEVGGTLGRVNEPYDIANAVLFLMSEDSRNISGQLITVASGANPRL